MNQVEHLLKLADEYQAGGIEDVCVKMLKSEPKSKDNAVKILYLATSTATARDDQKLFQVREECYELIKDMELSETQRSESYNDMEKNTMVRVVVKRNQRLETFVKDIYPQFMDLVESCLYHDMEEHHQMYPCPQHLSNGKNRENILMRIKNCSACRPMISYYFDERMIAMILDFDKIIRVSKKT